MSELTAPVFGPQKSLLRIGGALGIAAASISLLIFAVGCFGFNKVFAGLPLVPLIMSIPGMILSIIGGIWKSPSDEDPQVMAALFVNLIGFVGALLEMSIWLNWTVFYQQGQQVG
jgi:hypothetical protein